jgi:hypothetical protein
VIVKQFDPKGLIGVINLEIIEIKCKKCSKEIYVQQSHVRKEMFCTLGCMNSYMSKESKALT